MGESSLLVCKNNTTVPTAADNITATTNQRRENLKNPNLASPKVQPNMRP